MSLAYLVSGTVMAVALLLVFLAVGLGRRWHSYVPNFVQSTATAQEGPPQVSDSAPATTDGATSADPTDPGAPRDDGFNTLLWTLVFALVTLATVGGVFLLVTGPASVGGLLGAPIVVLAGLFVGLYLLVGVFLMASERGHPNSLAAAEMATVAGVLLLLAVTVQLFGA